MQTIRRPAGHSTSSSMSLADVGGVAKIWWGEMRSQDSAGSLTGRIGWRGGVEYPELIRTEASSEQVHYRELETLPRLGKPISNIRS